MCASGKRYIIPSLFGLLLSLTACERQCENAVCTADSDLQIVFVDSSDVNLLEAGLLQDSLIYMYSPTNDTIKGDANIETGTYVVRTDREMSQYTLSVGQLAHVDLLVYQKFVPSDFECCPGYWRIDSVYARGSKLVEVPDKGGFYLKVE